MTSVFGDGFSWENQDQRFAAHRPISEISAAAIFMRTMPALRVQPGFMAQISRALILNLLSSARRHSSALTKTRLPTFITGKYPRALHSAQERFEGASGPVPKIIIRPASRPTNVGESG